MALVPQLKQEGVSSKYRRCKNSTGLIAIVAAAILLFVIISSQIRSQQLTTVSQDLIDKLLASRELSLSQAPSNSTLTIHPENESDNLLLSDAKFEELLSYYSNVSAFPPHSWIHLNEQLFCPIRHSQTLYPDSTSNSDERLLKLIFDTQFVANCSASSHKFLILDLSIAGPRGIGATFGLIFKNFARALISGRIFLVTGSFEWAKSTAWCAQFDGMECYFHPPSNCDPRRVLNESRHNDTLTGDIPSHCSLGDNDEQHAALSLCTERVVYITQRGKGAGWRPTNEYINEWIHAHSLSNVVQLKAVLQSFIFRLKPVARNIVMRKVRRSLIDSLTFKVDDTHNNNDSTPQMRVFDPLTTIAWPIRASDKCVDNAMQLRGEMQCWSPYELYQLLQSIHVLNRQLDTVILTSEDFGFIQRFSDCVLYQKQCANTSQMSTFEHYTEFRWNVVSNGQLDSRPSMGNAGFRTFQHQDRFRQNTQFMPDIGIDLEHDVVMGAFSSVMLQMNAKYVIHTKSSSWLDMIWSMASCLFCESILWSKQLQVHGFHQQRDLSSENDLMAQREYKRLRNEYGRPQFLPQLNYKYEFFNRFCFELKQHGMLNKKVKWKHVLYAPDAWDTLRAMELKPDVFYALFGIQIYDSGWNHYCDRYTKLPFDVDVEYGV